MPPPLKAQATPLLINFFKKNSGPLLWKACKKRQDKEYFPINTPHCCLTDVSYKGCDEQECFQVES